MLKVFTLQKNCDHSGSDTMAVEYLVSTSSWRLMVWTVSSLCTQASGQVGASIQKSWHCRGVTIVFSWGGYLCLWYASWDICLESIYVEGARSSAYVWMTSGQWEVTSGQSQSVQFPSLKCSFFWSFEEMESLKALSGLYGIKGEVSFLSGSIESLNHEEVGFWKFSLIIFSMHQSWSPSQVDSWGSSIYVPSKMFLVDMWCTLLSPRTSLYPIICFCGFYWLLYIVRRLLI